MLLAEDGRILCGRAPVGQEDPWDLRGPQRANATALAVPGPGRNGETAQPPVAGLGQLFLSGCGGLSLSPRGHPRVLQAASVAGEAGARAGVGSITLLGTIPAAYL